MIQGLVDLRSQAGTDLWLVAVTNRLHQEVLQTQVFKDFPEDVEHPTLERVAFHFQFLEQAMVNVALASLLGHQIPQMANLSLTDAVDAPKSLLKAIRVPRQIVVDHEIRSLEVHALSGRVGCHQYTHLRIGTEKRLQAPALVPMRAAMDGHNGVAVAEDAGDPAMQVIQRIAMFGENDDLSLATRSVTHRRFVLKDLGEFIPFAITAGCDHGLGLLFKLFE